MLTSIFSWLHHDFSVWLAKLDWFCNSSNDFQVEQARAQYECIRNFFGSFFVIHSNGVVILFISVGHCPSQVKLTMTQKFKEKKATFVEEIMNDRA